MQPLSVTAHGGDGLAVVRLRGELDMAGTDDLRAALRAARDSYGDRMVIDLGGLEFMDSHGLSVLIDCYKALAAADGSLTLAAPRPIVRRTLEITGLHRRITVVDSVDDALATAADPSAASPTSP